MDPVRISETVALLFALAGFAVWGIWAIRDYKHWYYAIPPMSYFAFFLLILLSRALQLQIASTGWMLVVLLLYGAFLLLGFGILALYEFVVFRELA